MKFYGKAVLVVVSLLLSAGIGFAADEKIAAPDFKGSAAAVKAGVKSDVKATAVSTKDYAKGKAADTKSAATAKLVDLNTATAAELTSVPGIGGALAAKIIAGRPYANKAQLKSRKVVTPALYEQLKDFVIAKKIK